MFTLQEKLECVSWFTKTKSYIRGFNACNLNFVRIKALLFMENCDLGTCSSTEAVWIDFLGLPVPLND